LIKYNDNIHMRTFLFFIQFLILTNFISAAVTYQVTVPSGTKACYIAGEMNGWKQQVMNKLSETSYTITIDNALISHKYKYCSGPDWIYEELNASGGVISNRTYTANDQVIRWRGVYDPGNISYQYLPDNFAFTPLTGTRRIWVYLPPDYQSNPSKRYPVLYMHDGQNVFENGGFGSWKVQDALNQLHAAGNPVGIVVAINNSNDRLAEYAPFANANYAPTPRGDLYIDAIIKNIIPYINANYRTLPDRENTGIAGSSLGGLISFYAGLKKDSIFGRIGVISPAFWYNRTDLTTYVQNRKLNFINKTKIYFICGDSEGDADVVNDMQSFYQLTMNKGFTSQQVKYEVVAGGNHNEASWATQISRVYEFLFPLENNATTVQNLNVKESCFQVSSFKNQLKISQKNFITNENQLNLYNITGKLIFSDKFSNELVVKNIQNGLYICIISNENHDIFLQKVII